MDWIHLFCLHSDPIQQFGHLSITIGIPPIRIQTMAAFLRRIGSVSKINQFSNVHHQRHFNLTGKRCQSTSFSDRYQHLLKTRPFLLQAVQAGVLMGAGDFLAQTYIEKTPVKDVNYMRTFRFFALGLVFVVSLIVYLLSKINKI